MWISSKKQPNHIRRWRARMLSVLLSKPFYEHNRYPSERKANNKCAQSLIRKTWSTISSSLRRYHSILSACRVALSVESWRHTTYVSTLPPSLIDTVLVRVPCTLLPSSPRSSVLSHPPLYQKCRSAQCPSDNLCIYILTGIVIRCFRFSPISHARCGIARIRRFRMEGRCADI